MKRLTALLTVLIIAGSLLAQSRVKSITLTREGDNDYIETFEYTNNKLTTIRTSKGEAYTAKDDKRKIVFQAGKKNVFLEVKLNKEGKVEEYSNVKLKYEKDQSLKSLTYNKEAIKIKTTYDIYYDEDNRLAAAVADRNHAPNNYLLYYTDGLCSKVELGLEREVITPEWNGSQLVKLTGYFNSNKYITHEFYYDTNGLLTEEKIYEGEGNEKKLARAYKLEYEPGVGNEDIAYFSYNNWIVNLLFGQRTCDNMRYVVY